MEYLVPEKQQMLLFRFQTSNIDAELISLSDDITINHPSRVNYGNIQQNGTVLKSFNMSISSDIETGKLYPFALHFYDQENHQIDVIDVDIMMGKTEVLILDLDVQNKSGKHLQKTLNFKNVRNEYMRTWKDDISTYKSIFLLLGDFSSSYRLQEEEAKALTNYLDNGGRLYIEGARTWQGYEHTSLHDYLNITAANIDYFYYNTLNGIDGRFTSGTRIVFNSESNYGKLGNVILNPIEPAYSIFSNYSPNISCAVAYDAGNYKTIGSGFFLAGLNENETDSTLGNVIDLYLDFFDIKKIDVFKILNKQTGFDSFTYPNPFKTDVHICFSTEQTAHVMLNIYDSKGRLIKKILDSDYESGMHYVLWKGENEFGEIVKDGLYLYRLFTNDKSESGKIIFTH